MSAAMFSGRQGECDFCQSREHVAESDVPVKRGHAIGNLSICLDCIRKAADALSAMVIEQDDEDDTPESA